MKHIARKRFGQNFLHDHGVINNILRAIAPRPDQHGGAVDLRLEGVGPHGHHRQSAEDHGDEAEHRGDGVLRLLRDPVAERDADEGAHHDRDDVDDRPEPDEHAAIQPDGRIVGGAGPALAESAGDPGPSCSNFV